MPTYTYTISHQDGISALTGSYPQTSDAAFVYTATVGNEHDVFVPAVITQSKIRGVFILSSQNVRLDVDAHNEVQTISITGSPTGGTFTLTYNSDTTAAIPYDATAAAVEAALQALASIGTGGVSVIGGSLPNTPLAVTFRGGLARTNVAQLTSTSSLTGGSNPAINHATTTNGAAATQTLTLEAGMPIFWAYDLGPSYGSCPLTVSWTTGAQISNDSGAPASINVIIQYDS